MKFFTIIRSFDKFGESPKLLYKGEDQYKTKVGGLFSLAITIFVMVFAGVKLNRLAIKDSPDTWVNDSFVNLQTDFTPYNL